jgi:multiple sugar transport system substrate-binding protein
MKKTRTIYAVTVLAATVGLLLTGCSTPPKAAPSAASVGPVKITWWSNLGGMDLVAAAYNKAQSNIVVNFEQVPAPEAGGLEKLTNALKAGNAPCAATVGTSDLTSLATQGAFIQLDKIAGKVLDSFPQGSQDTVSVGDTRWAYPQAVGAMTYFYRQDVFDAAGVKVPTTWDEFREVAQKIQAAKPGTYAASFVNQDIRFITGLVSQAGAQWFSTDGGKWSVNMTDTDSMKVANYWQSLIKDDLVNVIAAGSAEWNNDVTTGKIVGFLGGPFNAAGMPALAPDQAGDWRVAVMPGWGDGATGGFGGSAVAITKDCDQPAATAKFLTWLTTNPAATEARASTGSSYPAFPAQSAVSAKTFLTPANLAYFGGQDIYSVFDKGAKKQAAFVWGPTMPGTTAAIIDGYSTITTGGTLGKVFKTAQDQTTTQMKDAGLLD